MKDIDQWFEACQGKQPPGTLAILIYTRGGRVHLGRGDEALEMRDFNFADIPTVARLIATALTTAYERGPSDAPAD